MLIISPVISPSVSALAFFLFSHHLVPSQTPTWSSFHLFLFSSHSDLLVLIFLGFFSSPSFFHIVSFLLFPFFVLSLKISDETHSSIKHPPSTQTVITQAKHIYNTGNAQLQLQHRQYTIKHWQQTYNTGDTQIKHRQYRNTTQAIHNYNTGNTKLQNRPH